MVGPNFSDKPLLEPTFLLVFLFDFPWYKKNTQNQDIRDFNFWFNFNFYFSFYKLGS